ncbi:MAG: hypothetical protein HRU09_18060 [Oligoflexales bacterium]|nr:hypothetical protein [Oligoflexales bacterium]
MQNYWKITLCLSNIRWIALLGAWQLISLPSFAQSFIEDSISSGTEGLGNHLFVLNPSAHLPSQMEVDLFFTNGFTSNKFESGNTNIENQSSLNKIGMAIGFDLGGGLGLGLSHQLIKSEEKNVNTNAGRDEFVETFNGQYSTVKAIVELSEHITAGFMMRFLDSEISLVGSFNTNPGSVTNFKPSLFGSGGGLNATINRLHLGAAYLPAMKGKTEIYSEEKIITEPGRVFFSIALQAKQFNAGLVIKRWIYKQDDRALGTSLDDANQTQIDLFGLNVDRNLIFAQEQRKLGMDYFLSSASKIKISLSQFTADINDDPVNFLPGENPDSPKLSYYVVQAILAIDNKKLTLMGGLTKSFQKTASYGTGGGKTSYEGDWQELIAGIVAKL